MGKKSQKWGEEVYAVLVKNADIKINDLEKHCRDNLSGYKVPKNFIFIDELPRNASGKILKRVIKERLDNNQLSEL